MVMSDWPPLIPRLRLYFPRSHLFPHGVGVVPSLGPHAHLACVLRGTEQQNLICHRKVYMFECFTICLLWEGNAASHAALVTLLVLRAAWSSCDSLTYLTFHPLMHEPMEHTVVMPASPSSRWKGPGRGKSTRLGSLTLTSPSPEQPQGV